MVKIAWVGQSSSYLQNFEFKSKNDEFNIQTKWYTVLDVNNSSSAINYSKTLLLTEIWQSSEITMIFMFIREIWISDKVQKSRMFIREIWSNMVNAFS